MNHLIKHLENDREFEKLTLEINERKYSQSLVSGLEGAAKDFFLAGVHEHTGFKNILVVTPDTESAERSYRNLLSFLPEERLCLLQPRDMILAEELIAQSREIREQRFRTLEKLYGGKKVVLVAPVSALMQKMMPARDWNKLVINLRTGQTYHRDDLIKNVVAVGYERSSLIENRGQLSVRGALVDIFPVGRAHPLRIEFFDDQVESIRVFDHESQRSLTSLESVDILPAAEVVMDRDVHDRGLKKIKETLVETKGKLEKRNLHDTARKLENKVNKHLQSLHHRVLNEGLFGYFSYFYGRGSSWLDYLEDNSLVVMDDAPRVKENSEFYSKSWKEFQTNLLLQGEALIGEADLYWELDELIPPAGFSCVYFNLFPSREQEARMETSYRFTSRETTSYYGQWDLLAEEIKDFIEKNYRVLLLVSNAERAHLLEEELRERGVEVVVDAGEEGASAAFTGIPPVVIKGELTQGFELPGAGMVIITEKDILPPRKVKKTIRKQKSDDGMKIKHFSDLKEGDFVVHQQHGIGEYLGIKTLEVNGNKKDYLDVRYAGGDKLYIPVEQIDLIQKYIGVEGKRPRIHRLGSGEWQRTRRKVEKSVEELAQELLSLYQARKNMPGYAFSSDHPWQSEFEAMFPYEETPDQLKAIEDVKRDLEKSYPMDRLICGDVGYGKTEVAMRAAFKVVMEGKQVALLVPTTILAHQHYRNFQERFASFPVNIGLLSRFLSRKEQNQAIKGLKKGTVDIVIGTHRLLSQDVGFSDLGLLVIDEEHRFGVRHKEKLKQMRLDVDVLTMTATPIPRTLHMSLAGTRDLSIIETPPENRYPVQTYVAEYSDQLIKDAVSREISRGGQVYFVYNRVKDIEKWGQKVKELAPEARVAVAHGQMAEASLERLMTGFLDQEYDVLVSTTIIEAGLDISNVNTIVIVNADRFGLAQLYQLRGRVGRTDRYAYAYLTYMPEKILREDAEKRLQAIKEFAELGSGFKIALRDLEIRGAGNILGAQQHGFIVSVGFDLYCKMLEEAVQKVKGEEEKETREVDPHLDLSVSAFIPSNYIHEQGQKINIYQRVRETEEVAEVQELEKELRDRFGPLPEEVENLMKLARVRVLARNLRVNSIQQGNGKIDILFRQDHFLKGGELQQLGAGFAGKIKCSSGSSLNIKIKIQEAREVISEVETVLLFLYELAGKRSST